VAAGRQKLSIGSAGEHLPEGDESEDELAKGFFDQDR